MSARIVCWDIENSPALGWFYGSTYQTNIAKVEQPSRVMAFACQVVGERRIDYWSDYHNGHDEMVAAAWQMIDDADALVSYNGVRHDSPHMRTEFLRVVGAEPSPVKEIDLYKVVKNRFRFQQNRLDFVLQDLDIGKKMEHEGIELWLKCLDSDETAWRKFRAYCRNDVKQTTALFEQLLPFMPASMLPNANLFDGEGCPVCGTADVQKRGFAYTGLSKTQRYRCVDGHWSTDGKALERASLRRIA